MMVKINPTTPERNTCNTPSIASLVSREVDIAAVVKRMLVNEAIGENYDFNCTLFTAINKQEKIITALQSEITALEENLILHEDDAIRVYNMLAKQQKVIEAKDEALRNVVMSDGSPLFQIDLETGGSSRVAGLIPREIAEQALAINVDNVGVE